MSNINESKLVMTKTSKQYNLIHNICNHGKLYKTMSRKWEEYKKGGSLIREGDQHIEPPI